MNSAELTALGAKLAASLPTDITPVQAVMACGIAAARIAAGAGQDPSSSAQALAKALSQGFTGALMFETGGAIDSSSRAHLGVA